jgi:hypothetical protein
MESDGWEVRANGRERGAVRMGVVLAGVRESGEGVNVWRF